MKIEFVDRTFVNVYLDSYSQFGAFRTYHTEYVPWTKKYVNKPVNLYIEEDGKRIKMYRGLLFYVIYLFKDEISNLDEIKKEVYSSLNIPVDTFDELREYQKEDLKKLLMYDMGLFQVSTGYGKTEVIARLLKYLKDNNIRTTVITSSNKARGEIVHRCGKYKVDVPKYFDTSDELNIINAKGFFTSLISQESDVEDYLKSVQVVIFDEVEKCLNDSIKGSLETLFVDRKALYGFSATTNKVSSDRLHPMNDECYLHQRNRDLVSYFGYATCYRLPDHQDVFIKKYYFNDDIEFGPDVEYNSQLLVNELYQTQSFVDNLLKVINDSEKCVYIPINSRISLDYWLQSISLYYKVLYISSSGYILYDPNLGECSITLDQVKNLMILKGVDVIFSTISGYNSLDLRNISTVLVMMNENSPDNTLQAVGRCREDKLIVSFIMYDKFIPIYSKKRWNQLNQVRNHYKNSKIIEEEIRL